MSLFSERLRALRRQRELSQAELARGLKISKSSVNMYERGEREPGIETLEAIADYFNIDMNYLLGKPYDLRVAEEDGDLVLYALPGSELEEILKRDHKVVWYPQRKNLVICPDDEPVEDGGILIDDFTVEMQRQTEQLTGSDKQLLLSMAKQLKEARKKEDK